MKLWVDDIRNAPDDSWHVARTALEAIRSIARFDFEVISLDHDISHQLTMGELGRPYPCNETFASVAYYLALKHGGTVGYPKIIVHSSNLVAGEEMMRVFSDAKMLAYHEPVHTAANRLEMEV